MNWVLVHNNTGKYVAKPGRKHSYTDRLQNAKTFMTKMGAERDSCQESEHPERIEDILRSTGVE